MSKNTPGTEDLMKITMRMQERGRNALPNSVSEAAKTHSVLRTFSEAGSDQESVGAVVEAVAQHLGKTKCFSRIERTENGLNAIEPTGRKFSFELLEGLYYGSVYSPTGTKWVQKPIDTLTEVEEFFALLFR